MSQRSRPAIPYPAETALSQQDAVEVLHDIEQRLDVLQWKSGAVHLWPLLRQQIWFALTKGRGKAAPAGTVESAQSQSCSGASSRRDRWTDLPPDGPRALFFQQPDCDLVETSRGLVDVRLDPWIWRFQQAGYHCRKFQLWGAVLPTSVERAVPVCHGPLASQPAVVRARTRVRRLVRCLTEPHIRHVCRSVNALFSHPVVSADALDRAHVLTNVYRRLLRHWRPELVVVSWYYCVQHMALLRAAFLEGICSVDVQHGKQGIYQGMYNHWSRIPDEGYSDLPDIFWQWGQQSTSNIESHNADTSCHIPLTGGNLWLQQWLTGDMVPVLTSRQRGFLQGLKKYRQVVLFSVQHQQQLPGLIHECLRQSPADRAWLIRLHPVVQHLHPELLESELREQTRADVSVQLATETPLFSILDAATHHVTEWSSVCYEALAFGVPTILTGTQGAALYADYVAAGHFSLAASVDELEQLLLRDRSEWNFQESCPYLATDEAVTQQALQQIQKRSRNRVGEAEPTTGSGAIS